jgi:hypothetical protein
LCFTPALASGDVSLVLNDITTWYFEAGREDDLRKVGYAKVTPAPVHSVGVAPPTMTGSARAASTHPGVASDRWVRTLWRLPNQRLPLPC